MAVIVGGLGLGALRLAHRWISTLIELKVPRGAGASAAAMLLLASTCYGVVKGGHAPAIAAQVQDICDTAANSVGFRITEVALAGEHEVSREDILALAGITGRSSLLFLDAGQARAAAVDQSVDRASRPCSSFIPAGCASTSRSAKPSRSGRRKAASI